MQRAEAIRVLSSGINHSVSLKDAFRKTERPLQPESVLDPDKQRLAMRYSLKHSRNNSRTIGADSDMPKNPLAYFRTRDWKPYAVPESSSGNCNSAGFLFSAEPLTKEMRQALDDANGGPVWPTKMIHYMSRGQVEQLIRTYSKIG